MVTRFFSIGILSLSALALAACGSSGGNSAPPAPPGPVTPPPPPEPTFEERLEDLAEHDPNDCRARTPGFEALGGWLKNEGRELGGSRVWLRDNGSLDDEGSHAARVNKTFTECAARDIARYAEGASVQSLQRMIDEANLSHGLLVSSSFYRSPEYGTDPLEWFNFLDNDGDAFDTDVMLITALGNGVGEPTAHVVDHSDVPNTGNTEYFDSLVEALKPDNLDSTLWILVGGHTGDSDSRRLAGRNPAGVWGPSGTSICGAAEPLCLFGPWQGPGGAGTSIATPQVAAALDTVWAVWPDMDILDLRNLAFDCAENMTVEGVSGTERSYSYSNGRSFTSTTNTTWGHGILSLTCLFTANGGLQNPVTGNPISGGISGPIAGPVTGATITGVDYTGRDFGYGFARPVARENWALAATSRLSASGAISWNRGIYHAASSVLGAGAAGPAAAANLTVAGNAIGLTAEWRALGLTLRGGVAVQPEGAGSLTGSRAFRAPSTVSAAVTAAYGRALPHGFSAHLQADHWRTLSAIGRGRSLWQDAQLSESRISAALVKRMGRHEFALQAAWQSGIAGSLDVDGKRWPVAGIRESGVWLTWRHAR